MSLQEAFEEVTKYQLERNINLWSTALVRMLRAKTKTPAQQEATSILEKWIEDNSK